eukprot:s1430_g16.t1
MLRKSWLLAIGGLVGVTGSYIAPRYQILDAKADIRDLDVGDLDDMEVDVPKPFVEHDFKRDPASFMTSGSSGVSMAFVQLDVKWAMEHGKHETTSLARSWTSLLENGGFSAQIYDTDPGSILIVNKIPAQNIKIKEFVLSQPHVDYYELNQKRFYPDGRISPLVSDDERRERMATIPGRLGADKPKPVYKPSEPKTVSAQRLKMAVESTSALKARVAELEARLRELEELQSSSELLELRALVEAQEAALEDQRRIIESQSALIEDLSSHLNATSSLDGQASSTAANASAAIPPSSKEPAPSPSSPDPQGPGPSGPSKRRSGSGYGRGTMSAPGLRKPVSASSGGAGAPGGGREKVGDSRSGKENQKRFGCSSGSISSASSGGLVRGPSPRTTPRSASTGTASRDARRSVNAANSQGAPNVSSVGLPPSLPLLRQEA